VLRRDGNSTSVIFWSKRNGERARVRFVWWPLVVSLAVSIGLTVLLNMGR
jgi:hypothetical protein